MVRESACIVGCNQEIAHTGELREINRRSKAEAFCGGGIMEKTVKVHIEGTDGYGYTVTIKLDTYIKPVNAALPAEPDFELVAGDRITILEVYES